MENELSVRPGPYSIGSDHWPGLSKLIEELGELQQVAGKLLGTGGMLQHWDGTDLRERLTEEMGDALAAIYFFARYNKIDFGALSKRESEKFDLFEQWHREQTTP